MFVISLVLFAISIGLSVWSVNICKQTEETIKETRAKYESAKEEINTLKKANGERLFLRSNTTYGSCPPVEYLIERHSSYVNVLAVHRSIDGDWGIKVLIKQFLCEDDQEFAHLEAQELLDHLNEK